MKIVHYTPTLYSFSGIDKVVLLLAQQQKKEGHEVTIVTLDAKITPPEGIRIVVLGMPKSLLLQRVYRLVMFLDTSIVQKGAQEAKNCDIVYSHQYPMNLLAMRAKKQYGCRYIYYDNGIPDTEFFYSIQEKIYITLFRWFTLRTIRSSDEVISISKYLQRVLREQSGITSRVVYDMADPALFFPRQDDGEIRKKHSIPTQSNVILFVGRISPHKGIEYLIQSVQLLRKNIPDTYLLIVGKPTFSAYQKKLSHLADGHIIFSGFVSDEALPKYFSTAQVYATATLWEGFDLPVVEAQAMGKPVVAYDIGPHSELIDSHGMLTPVKDIEKFAAALEVVLHRKHGA